MTMKRLYSLTFAFGAIVVVTWIMWNYFYTVSSDKNVQFDINSEIIINADSLDQVIMVPPFDPEDVHIMIEKGIVTQVIIFGEESKYVVTTGGKVKQE